MIVWRTAFLIALPCKGTIAGAATVANVSRTAVYSLMKSDAGFEQQVRAIIAKHEADEASRRERQVRYHLQATA